MTDPGGETIREINRMSGAYVELSRSQPPNPRERVFKISGNPNQVQQAMRLISEKAGLVSRSLTLNLWIYYMFLGLWFSKIFKFSPNSLI